MLQWCRLSEEMEVELPRVEEGHDLTTFLAKLRSNRSSSWAATLV